MKTDFNLFCYTSHGHYNWFFKKYYLCSGNLRYYTFQLTLNMLSAFERPVVIVETGCQRFENDIGAGMSTSIFGEFCEKHEGKLYTVEISQQNLDACKQFTKEWSGKIDYVLADSALWLSEKHGIRADLLYLDSLDYDYGGLLNIYGNGKDTAAAIAAVDSVSFPDIIARHSNIILPAQEHCLRELKAAFDSGIADDKTIIMIDDNQLPGGGKSRLAKLHLIDMGWTCLLDATQTIWVKPFWVT